MRLLFTILLLSFPVIEIWGIFKLSALYGWWFFLYMILVTYLGWRLIKEEKQLVFAKLMGAMTQGGNPIKAIRIEELDEIKIGVFSFVVKKAEAEFQLFKAIQEYKRAG